MAGDATSTKPIPHTLNTNGSAKLDLNDYLSPTSATKPKPKLNTKTKPKSFTLNDPSSPMADNASSPFTGHPNGHVRSSSSSGDSIHSTSASDSGFESNLDSGAGHSGRLPDDVYDGNLVWWRASMRRKLVKRVEWESEIVAAMQGRIRTPWLDTYFVYSSTLGTHTFFMVALPIAYFFGYNAFGRGLLLNLAVGVYLTSFLKDLACSPRPFAPPVTRLTMGSHHLEYGFPSTHSTNSVSMALYIFWHLPVPASLSSLFYSIYPFASASNSTLTSAAETVTSAISETASTGLSETTYFISCFVLLIYMTSIVFGRLYTAMHSFVDVIAGVSLGVIVCVGVECVRSGLEGWLTGGWDVPVTIILLILLLINQHPQPVDDCPCFEDAIAFLSVVMGCLLARWHAVRYGFSEEVFFTSLMPGSSWEDWQEFGTWTSVAFMKMVIGILIIFTWRLLAKPILHFTLPPIFRLLAHAFTLPHRRFYTPATDYDSLPVEKGLRAIPSVIDLPGHMEVEGGGSSAVRKGTRGREVKFRNGNVGGGVGKKGLKGESGGRDWEGDIAGMEKSWVNGSAEEREREGGKIKHYDADVLTKVIVYCGIAVLACEWIPIMFEVLGWGVRSH